MKRMPYRRPTTHYDERIKTIDKKICKLINSRKEISHNNPGYPPFEYISNWAKEFNLYDEQLKSIFGAMWNEDLYKPSVEPKEFLGNLPVLKSIEIEKRLFSITSIRQYSNSSIVNFNIDWDNINASPERQLRHTSFNLFINEIYDCQMLDGCGGDGHFHYNFLVSPPLPDTFSGIKLIFKEYNPMQRDELMGNDIIIQL